MINVPKVSVITPTYNRKDYLYQAIDSVLAQTFGDWELLIIDDGSSDGTQNAVRERYSDERIKYYYQENQGQSVARNRGLKLALGGFICFLDSDNRWLPDKLAIQVNSFVENPEDGVNYGKNITIDKYGAEVDRHEIPRFSGMITPELLVDNFIPMNSTMVRSEILREIGGFNNSNRWDEDYELWLEVSAKYTFRFIDEWLGEYRIMPGQISDNKEVRIRANEQTILRFHENHPTVVSSRVRSQALARFYRRWAYFAAREHRFFDALSKWWNAVKVTPLSIANVRMVLSIILAQLRPIS